METVYDIDKFIADLKNQLDAFDLKTAATFADAFVKLLLKASDEINLSKAARVLKLLRNKRMFIQMIKVADTLIQTGRSNFTIRKLYAQALIDSGNYTAALSILQALTLDITNTVTQDETTVFEHTEAKGLIGRIYKQLYINANSPANPQCARFLSLSINAYYDVYKNNKGNVWHGINAVALTERAKRDGTTISNLPDSLQIAKDILSLITEKNENEKADAWDFATAAEACIALNKPEDALKWLSGYARMPYCDAFELASTLRQFEEVWQLDLNLPTGQLILPLLRAELIKRQGSNLIMDTAEIKLQKTIENQLTSKYDSLVEKTKSDAGNIKLEKVFGADSFNTYKWYMLGAARSLAVARIGKEADKGFGTGFLIKGKDLKDDWGDEIFLLTNAHVVSNNPVDKALRPEEAVVIFEALNRDEEFRDFTIIWSSPSTELDATILKFNNEGQQRLQVLTREVKFYPAFKYLPAIDEPPTQKVYVIGHPYGGTLQISLQDNLLLDHQDPKIHYRTPTDGGSSGSPVFNQQWDLIGLHHAGSEEMPCLNGKPGTYKANEGIWIQSIRRAIP